MKAPDLKVSKFGTRFQFLITIVLQHLGHGNLVRLGLGQSLGGLVGLDEDVASSLKHRVLGLEVAGPQDEVILQGILLVSGFNGQNDELAVQSNLYATATLGIPK